MIKKQGIIEQKITTRPSFKNLFDIEEAKVPSRSKSKNKSVSQQKISAIPVRKSPSKVSHTSIKIQDDTKTRRYSTRRSRETSPKSVKKNHNTTANPDQENMKAIINLKNKVVRLERAILDQQVAAKQKTSSKRDSGSRSEASSKYRSESGSKGRFDKHPEAVDKALNMKSFLDEYLLELKSQTGQISHSYLSKVDEFSNDEAVRQMERFEGRKLGKPVAGMQNLEAALAKAQKLLM